MSDFAFDAIIVTFVPFLMEKFRAGMLLTITGYANMLKYRKKHVKCRLRVLIATYLCRKEDQTACRG